MRPSSLRTSDSPRSVQRFLRFEDEDGSSKAKKKTGSEPGSRSPASTSSAPMYSDQLPLGGPSHHFNLSHPKRTFMVHKADPPSHATPPHIRYNEQLPLGSTPHYISPPPRRKLVGRDCTPRRPITPTSTTKAAVRYTDQLPLGSPSRENWNLVHQNTNRVPIVSSASFGSSGPVPPPPPLIQATKATRHSQVTKFIRKFENVTTRQSPSSCAIVIQSAFRQYLARKLLEAKQIEYKRSIPLNYAAVQIQMMIRSWICRTKLRIAMLEKNLNQCENVKAYSLKWVEERKQKEMYRFLEKTREESESKISHITRELTKTQKIIKDLRTANKKFRSQNITLTEANGIQAKRVVEEEKKNKSQLREIEKLEAEVAQLKREEKRLVASGRVYPKFVDRFSQTLEEVNEYAEVESNAKTAYKEVIARTINLVKETCVDEHLIHDVMEIGMTMLFTDPNQLSEAVQEQGIKKKSIKYQRDISETETSETSGSDDECLELDFPKISNFDCHSEILGSDDASTASDEYEEISVKSDDSSNSAEESSGEEISVGSEIDEEIIDSDGDEEISAVSYIFKHVAVEPEMVPVQA
uniref:Syntaxin N-terminal domain-containing protein n=1 Tax=Amphora coffeiformis TaxID=265554 RepID=A0A7S3L157_9STRA